MSAIPRRTREELLMLATSWAAFPDGYDDQRKQMAEEFLQATSPEEKATVGGEWMEQTIQTHMHRAEHYIAIEQAKINPDNALIAVLCDSVRMCREYVRAMASAPSPQKRNIAPIDDPKEIALCNALASLQLMTCERDDLNAEVAKLSSIETELRAFMRGQGYGHDSHVDTCIWSFFKDRPTGKLRTADLKRKEPKTIIDDGLDMNSIPHSKEKP